MNRLREYRDIAGISQQRLADLAGTQQQQIDRWEKGKRPFPRRWAARLSPHLNCKPADLEPDEEIEEILLVGDVGAGEKIYFFDDGVPGTGLEEVEAPPGLHDGIALRIKGNSMAPRYFDGELVFYRRSGPTNPTDFLNEDCVVRLEDGSTMLKRLEPGSRPDTFTLRSYNPTEAVIPDARIEWAARVEWRRRK